MRGGTPPDEPAWRAELASRAPGPDDTAALEATSAARALVIGLSGTCSAPADKALVAAWFSLGIELARATASPTLVAGHAAHAASFAALGALLEGNQEGRREAAARHARAAWAPERSVVVTPDGVAAVALPPDDALDDRAGAEDALVAHAERIAARLLARGARRVHLAGGNGRAAAIARAVLAREGFDLAEAPSARGGAAPAPGSFFARLVAPFARARGAGARARR